MKKRSKLRFFFETVGTFLIPSGFPLDGTHFPAPQPHNCVPFAGSAGIFFARILIRGREVAALQTANWKVQQGTSTQ